MDNRLDEDAGAAKSPDMKVFDNTALGPLVRLAWGALRPPPGRRRIVTALIYGVLCHALFAAAVLSMVVAMFFGMSESLGRVPHPWSILANFALVAQFPLIHSLLLSDRGRGGLARLAPKAYAATLATTVFAIIASLQLLALFVFWTPSGIIWWRADGAALWVICGLSAVAWLMLSWASIDAGAEVQSGALGWLSLMQKITPKFPDMPTRGLFAVIRQPIYVSFALTTWFVPVWTPDQLALASVLTAYCLAAPRLKERRFARRYGADFDHYKRAVPYAIPRFDKGKP